MGPHRIIRSTIFIGVLVALTGSATAYAQKNQKKAQKSQKNSSDTQARQSARVPVRSQLSGAALEAWDSAVVLYEARDYSGARVQYWRAWTLSSNPRVLFNVAVCDKNLRRYAKAVSIWRMQLRVGEGKLSQEDIAIIEEAIGAVSPFVTTVKITIDTPGATVLIDDENVGQSPFLKPLEVDVGQHRVIVRKAGFRDYIDELVVARNQIGTLDIKLEPLVITSLVSINVQSPKGATILIDGVDMGPSPFKGQIPVGRHTIEAKAPGYVSTKQTSIVTKSSPLNLSFSLSKERNTGELRIRADEADATILVDGKVVGQGQWAGILPNGPHQLLVKKKGFRPFSSEILLTDDQIRTITVPMRREERGPAWVWWTVGTTAILATGAVATYFIARPTEVAPVTGSWGNISTALTGPRR